MKKELNKVIMFIGFVVTIVGLIICAAADGANFASVFTLSTIAAVLAVTFIFAKNDIVKNVGYGLAGLLGVYGIGMMQVSEDFMVASVGMIVMFVAAVIYFFVVCLKFFGFVKKGEHEEACGNVGNLLNTLSAYKEMQQEKVLSDEEFAELKQKIFETADKKTVSLDDLKKWKKLLDQGVITEEEFTQIKSGIFSK